MSDVGHLVLGRDPMGDLRILQADPLIKISASLIDEIRHAMVVLGDDSEASIIGDIVRIKAVNQTVIYRLGEQVANEFAYYAEWPD